ncbi:MAG: helix-turn-helix transcriptional regulator [Methanomassiliicoccus sp.]|nr:helix-turn-helix transcriptional regulator [Methanomassiliicoccus sp.]
MFGKGHDYNGKRISPMQVAILILLRRRPMYGYEVLTELRARFDGVWNPQTGSIYPALKRLDEHGLVAAERRDDTDYYHITEAGDGWILEVLQRSPRDLRLMTRYFELIGTAADDAISMDAERPGAFSQMFEDDDIDAAARERKLRAARERIAKLLANIDRELEEVERNRNEGGRVQ